MTAGNSPNTEAPMTLDSEIAARSAEIHTDAYSMSFGELMNLYQSDELDIHPEFQRFFRWTDEQKSRLVESILLGIPLPSIFVAQRADGVWDVIDGLQRLSTVFQLAGILQDENRAVLPALKLNATKYLPSLAEKYWEHEDDARSLTSAQRLYIKRAKIDVKIIKKESGESSKYELFQRLNTGGTQLSDQEVRNCILVSMNRPLFERLRGLAAQANFLDCCGLTERALQERFDLELVLRFLIFRNLPPPRLRNIGDLGEFLTNEMIEMVTNGTLLDADAEEAFQFTFRLLEEALQDDSFRKYDRRQNRFKGGFLISAFEVVAIGIAHNAGLVRGVSSTSQWAAEKIKGIWQRTDFAAGTGSGIRASQRIPVTIPIGREVFRP